MQHAPFQYKSFRNDNQWRKNQPEAKKKRLGKTARTAVKAVLGFFILCFLVGAAYLWTVIRDIPPVESLQNINIPQSTIIMDREGNELYRIFGGENRKYVASTDISDYLKNATVAAEDSNFYKHGGFDTNALLSALWRKVLHPETRLGGASTITQQLIKLVFLTSERTATRKIKELVLSYELESQHSKDKILELYLNQISYGSNSYGIETAAQTYFGKTAKDLNLPESAILASIPKGPSLYSPYGDNPAALMGECKVGNKKDAAADLLTLQVEAVKKVNITTREDDADTEEKISLKVGETKVYQAEDVLHLSLDSAGSVKILYQGKSVNIDKKAKSFDIAKADILGMLSDGDRASLEAAKTKATCKSMDDVNYTIGRKDYVLKRMKEENMITPDQMQTAWEQANKIAFKPYRENIKDPHFVFYVKQYLEDKYGKELVERGGLKVKTTLDPKLQELAQKLVTTTVPTLAKYKISNAALLSANPKTGEILTMVGSKDYWDEKIDGNVNITTSLRQPGSSFKPFIYANYFQEGHGAGSILWDTKTKFGDKQPNNSDGKFLGPMAVRKAIAWSRNIPAMKAFFLGGDEDKVLDYLSNFGFNLKERRAVARQKDPTYSYGYPLAIGSAEMKMIDMVGGYSVFANMGVKKDLNPILEIRDKDGVIMEALDTSAGKQVIDPQVAYIVNDILSDESARPAGFWRDRITIQDHEVAVKTGTSNKRISDTLILPVDNWTIGYSASLVTAVWGGNSDGSVLSATAFDVNTMAGMWKDFMTKALEGKPKEEWDKPEGITTATVSLLTGLRATDNTPPNLRVTDIFPSFGVPKDADGSLKAIQIDSRNNLLANENCPPAFTKTVYVLTGVQPEKQYPWQESPWDYLGGDGNESGVLAKAPTDISPLCKTRTDAEKPSITILSPLSFGQVTRGSITVAVKAVSSLGVDKVEFYMDGALMTTASTAPYTGIFVMPTSTQLDSVHTLKAILYDKAGFTAESSVDISVTSSDTNPPQITFTTPVTGAQIPLDKNLDILVDAYDNSSSVKNVDISIDGTPVGTIKKPPYKVSVNLAKLGFQIGTHTISAQAVDRFNNAQSASVQVQFVAAGTVTPAPAATPTADPGIKLTLGGNGSDKFSSAKIVTPSSGDTVNAGESTEIRVIQTDSGTRDVEVSAEGPSGKSVIQKVTNVSPDVDNIVVFWKPKNKGSYTLSAQVVRDDGTIITSIPVTVTVK